MKKENNAGAIASNVGDDFHLLWAAKKLLELLKFDTDLEGIVVEGHSNIDMVEISESDLQCI